MFKVVFGLVSLAVAVVIVLATAAHPTSLFANASAVTAPAPQIVVVHADALVVNGQRLRLTDEVAPQPAPYAQCVAEAVAARQARLRLFELAAVAKSVSVTPTGGVDEFGRTKAQVMLDGSDPARTLIAEGLAVAPGARAVDWCGPVSQEADGVARIAMLSAGG